MHILAPRRFNVGISPYASNMDPFPRYNYRLTPTEFVERWLPRTKGLAWGDWGSRKAAMDLLAECTGYGVSTVNNWLGSTERVPDLVMRHLWLLDQVWSFQASLNHLGNSDADS